MADLKLHYDNARQAQQLFDNDPQNLRFLYEELEVQATARDGWIRLEGEPDNLKAAQQVFASLEQLLRDGNRPRRREFEQAVHTVKQEGVDAPDRPLEENTRRSAFDPDRKSHHGFKQVEPSFPNVGGRAGSGLDGGEVGLHLQEIDGYCLFPGPPRSHPPRPRS